MAVAIFRSPRTVTIPTMISLDYERDRWGYLRIVLDAIANHIDACGNSNRVEVQVGPSTVTISDPGPGFDHALLTLLHSTKSQDAPTIGQFGEGIKLVAAACLRNGMSLSIRSRDWEATAVVQTVSYRDENGQHQLVRRLAWEITTGLPAIHGTRTTIRGTSLPEELTRMFRNWREYFLDDAARSETRIWPDEKPRLFVRGVFVRELGERHLFSYNLPTRSLNRDRDTVDIIECLRDAWKSVTDPDLASRYFAAATRPDGPTQDVVYFNPGWNARVWLRAWEIAFGSDAVIATTEQASYIARAMGRRPVHLPWEAHEVARLAGVPRDADIRPDNSALGVRPLSEQEQLAVQRAMETLRRVIPCLVEHPVEAMDNPPPGLMGTASGTTGTIRISSSILNDPDQLLVTLLEEVAHLESCCGDLSRGFEEWLVRFGATAAAKLARSDP